MTGDEYRAALDHVGMSQVGAARFFGVAPSTSRRWLSDGVTTKRLIVPRAVSMLLCVMMKKHLSPGEVLEIEAALTKVAETEDA
jgi:hypothetical protein